MVSSKRRIRIAEQNEIALPADLMRKHHLNAGDTVLVEDTVQGIVITRGTGGEQMSLEDLEALFAKPSAEEIERRQALFVEIMANRQKRDIRPMTSSELVRLARAEEGLIDDPTP